MSADDLVLDRGSAELIGSLIEASAKDLQWTNNTILAIEKARHRDTAQSLIRLYEAIAKLPDTMLTVAMANALDRASFDVELAYRLVSEPEET